MALTVKVKRLLSEAQLPSYARPGDAGLDLFAAEHCTIEPGSARLIRTGIAIELPSGTEAQVRPRSGLALRHQITVLNTPGTIDEGYRGEVGVILINHGRQVFEVTIGARIAQLVVKPVLTVQVQEVESLAESVRGTGGFGSTG
ncbi:MAG: dUTP diphosphatase [Vicinamibacterales bacterium]